MPLKKLIASTLLKTPLPEMLFGQRSRRRIAVFAYHRILPPRRRAIPL
jgi:hypothetical protein